MHPSKLSYTVDQACDAMSLPRTAFYAAVRDGHLQTFKVGRRRMVSAKALTDYINRLERESAPRKATA